MVRKFMTELVRPYCRCIFSELNKEYGMKGVVLGHRVTAHGCVIERGAMIGIGASVLNGARVDQEAIVGAGEILTLLSGWHHSGFHVFCEKRILPKEETALEKLARYIIRASFS